MVEESCPQRASRGVWHASTGSRVSGVAVDSRLASEHRIVVNSGTAGVDDVAPWDSVDLREGISYKDHFLPSTDLPLPFLAMPSGTAFASHLTVAELEADLAI